MKIVEHSAEALTLAQALGGLGCTAIEQDRIVRRLNCVEARRFKRGKVILRQGDAPGHAYIVARGKVLVSRRGVDGKTSRAAELGRGAIVGEMSLLTGEVRSAAVMALEDTELFVLTADDFHFLCGISAGFRRRMDELLRERRAQAKRSAARKHAGPGRLGEAW